MKKSNSVFLLIGLVLGILGGMLLPNVMTKTAFIGTIYINILKFMIIPIIFTSVALTFYKSKDNKGKLIVKTIILFIIMFIITFLITSLIAYLISFGKEESITLIPWDGETSKLGITDIIVSLFPSNIGLMLTSNSVFACLLVASLFGLSASKVKDSNKLMDVMESLKNVLYKMIEYIMYMTPFAIISLIGNTVAVYGSSILITGFKYIIIALICSVVILIVVMILPVWIFSKINPFQYIKKVWKVWLITLTTCSSVATLPSTIKTCNEKFKISNNITDIVVPLGCTIHMCGGAVSFSLLAIFCANMFGINISLEMYLLMIISATLINMSAPGIPSGGIVIGASYLMILGIPLSFIGFYAGIYKILDMAYTTLNVTGDITANILIQASEKKA